MKFRIRKVSTLFIVSVSLAALALGFTATTGGAAATPNLRAEPVPAWWYQARVVPEVKVDLARVRALMDVKVALRAQVRAADELFASSDGKATIEARRALAVERNRAYTAVLFADEPDEVSAVADQFAPAVAAVTGEVAAWEKAEAERKAEEERKAREAAERAVAASRSSSRPSAGGSGGGSGQTPRQYLDAVASAYGASIAWSAAACGRSGSWVSGCYAGGSTVTVTTNAYSSWNRAKGEGRNVVLHETAHFLTRSRCGTVYVGGDRFENVTDAFAVLLGAGAATGYGYTSADMELAKALSAGRCGV